MAVTSPSVSEVFFLANTRSVPLNGSDLWVKSSRVSLGEFADMSDRFYKDKHSV